ncbi:MAG: hypothetical protein U9R19_00785 [Bacteroidota bacterium]|nr:hypothetical protein [Bacteroidota bacterium]
MTQKNKPIAQFILSILIVLAGWIPLSSQEVILYEEFSQNPSPYFQAYFSTQSLAMITNNTALLTGGTASTWLGNGDSTTATNAWSNNLYHRASFSGYIQAQNYNAIELQITFKQTASASLKYSWFRVLANGIQQTAKCGRENFNPTSFDNDIFQTVVFNLNDYAGQEFVLSFQSSCRANGPDAVYIDKVRILYNNTDLPLDLPYTQNFDSTYIPASWYSCPDSFSFGWQNGEFSSLGIPPHGNYISSINYQADTVTAISKLISPYFNFDGLGSISLIFDAYADHEFSVLVSSDTGQVFSDTLLQQNSTSGWESFSIDLSQFAGLGHIKIAFANNDQNDLLSLFAIDNFSLTATVQANHDIGISALLSPVPSQQFSAIEDIGVRIRNYSQVSVSNFLVGFKINDGFVYIDSISTNLLAGDSLDYFFSQTADMSVPGNYVFTTWVNKYYDINPINDTLETLLVSTYPTITDYPYLQSFEQENFWLTGGQNVSWQQGIPAGNFINSASDGQKAWVTNLSGSYNVYEASWVRSPVFDFTNLSAPVLSFDILIDCEEFEDGACLQFSIDQGDTWTTLGAVGDNQYWYNSTWVTGLTNFGTYQGWSANPFQGWVNAEYDLSFLNGQAGVRFRFLFGSTENFNSLEGFAFDDFRIYDIQGHDLAITGLAYPIGNCTMSNVEPVMVEIKNMGLNDVSGFELSYRLNNEIPITEFITDTIAADTTFFYTFSTPVNLSAPGIKSFFLSLNDSADQAAFNDTLTVVLELEISSELPYFENFDAGVLPEGWFRSQAAGSDGWLFGDNLGSFYFPVPAHGMYAASNDDTCYCNASADMLITPAFDFSQYQSINIEFDAYLTGYLNSSGSVLASYDCGFSWQTVSYIPGSAFSWQTINLDLSAYSGYSSVKLAFLHNDNGGWGAGLAIDNVYLTGTAFAQTQQIALVSGWGIMSGYIDPTNPAIDSVFSEVVSNLVIVKNGSGQVYWPYFGLNIIGNHEIGEGYQYSMNQADTLHITGVPAFPQYTTLNISAGWSIIAYLRNVPALATEMMNPIVSEILLMKNENGLVFWPAFNLNMIGDMKPGKGYQINLSSTVSFSYPANP